MIETRELTTSDGLLLEAELAAPPDRSPRAAMVLCHPHPQHGGTMRSIVIGALFDALPRAGVACLRFNFRGVGRSEGSYDHGHGEQLDARAAVAALAAEVAAPLVLTGWSFGADVALTVVDGALSAWLAIAPPLRIFPEFGAVAGDPRPKLLALAERDEFREPSTVVAETAGWVATETAVVKGASHFFVGRTERLVELAVAYVDALVKERE